MILEEPTAHSWRKWGKEQVGEFHNLAESMTDSTRCRVIVSLWSAAPLNIFFTLFWVSLCNDKESFVTAIQEAGCWFKLLRSRRQQEGIRALIPVGTCVLGWQNNSSPKAESGICYVAKFPPCSTWSKRSDRYGKGNWTVLESYGTESDICCNGLIKWRIWCNIYCNKVIVSKN